MSRRGTSLAVASCRRRPVALAANQEQRWSSSTAQHVEAKKDESVWWAPYAVVGVLGSLGAWFWRASRSQANRSEQLDLVESQQALDHKERLELRDRNAGLTPVAFEDVARGCSRELGGLEAECTYPDFVRVATRYLDRPLALAHYIDRVVLNHAALERQDSFKVGFLVAVLGLALNATPDERAMAFAGLVADDDGRVPRLDAARLLDWIALAGHIPSSALVVETADRYPAQQYARRTPAELLGAAADVALGKEHKDDDVFSTTQIAAILQSKTLRIT